MARGRLRVFLGASPGVGKTFAMLEEARRAREAGVDVAVGIVETHGREATAALLDGLEQIGLRSIEHRGVVLSELDAEAVLARCPELVLVDELAHTNAPSMEHPKRWMDVHRILDAGIDVMTTVNVQHVESLTDVVERITGAPQRETVPDAVLREADRIELVDIAPRALRDRLADGLVYPAGRIDAALSNFFRLGNLTALRELALLWLADEVDETLRIYRRDHGIDATWEARERVVVAVTGGPEGETLIRRAARIAARAGTHELIAVHVSEPDGLAAGPSNQLLANELLVQSLGGSFHHLVASSTASALIEFARSVDATQLVIGVSRRGRFGAVLGGPSISAAVIRQAGDIDVHIVSHGVSARRRLPRAVGALDARRRLAGFAIAAAGLPLLTALLAPARSLDSLVTDVLWFQLVVVIVAVVGGIWPALAAGLAAGLLLNYFFVEPLYTLSIASVRDVAAIVIFMAVAIIVSVIVDQAARRARAARRSAAESETLVSVAGAVISGNDALATLVTRLRETFGLSSVLLIDDGVVTHSSRDAAAVNGSDVESSIPLGEGARLYLRGSPLTASDRSILGAFVSQLAIALLQRRLASEVDAARPVAEADRMRSALLASVGHDVRRPLASATAAVTALRSASLDLDEDDRAALLQTADESLASLGELLANLLDVSRLQAGALGVELRTVPIDDLVGEALDELRLGPDDLALDLDPQAEVLADPVLARRALVNLIANAQRYAPYDRPPLVTASRFNDRVQIRVIDTGPGVEPERRGEIFMPFQRTTDTDNTMGLGLGLALSKGFIEAMDGTLEAEDTPGGGLTMVIELPTGGDGQSTVDGAS